MTRFLWAFGLFTAAVLAGALFGHDAGLVYIAIGGYSIETTVLVAAGLLCLFLLLLSLFSRILHALFSLPRRFQRWHARFRLRRAKAKTRRGLIAFSEGYWREARDALISAADNTDTPLLNYLTAARAAQELGESPLRDDYLRRAEASMPEATIAVELTQAQLQLANNQWEQALATLRHLQDIAPKHPYVQKLLMELYAALGDWTHLEALLPELQRNKTVDAARLQEITLKTRLAGIKRLLMEKNADGLLQLLKSLPKSLAYDPRLLAPWANAMLQLGSEDACFRTLQKALQKSADSALLEVFSRIKTPQALGFSESLLSKYPNSAPLLLCVAQQAASLQLWGKARHAVEKSISISPTPEACATLGQLLEQFGEDRQACAAYRQGLENVLKEKPSAD